MIAGTVTTCIPQSRAYTTSDWTWWEDYKEEKVAYTPTYFGEAYDALRALVDKHSLTKTACPRSKKWWDQEIEDQLRVTKRARGEKYEKDSKALKKLIRKKKRGCWNRFLEEQKHRHLWEVVRIAKDPFHTQESMGDLTDGGGVILTTQQEKVDEFRRHHLVTHPHDRSTPPRPPRTPPPHTERRRRRLWKGSKELWQIHRTPALRALTESTTAFSSSFSILNWQERSSTT